MKKHLLICTLFAAALSWLPAAAQSICFWTNDADAVPIRIYIDHEYFGDVTVAYEEQPLIDSEGCVSVDTTPDRHELTAVDKYGRVYKGWPGWIRPRADKVNYLKIRAGQFRTVDRDDYDWVFVDWIPIYVDVPVVGYGIPLENLDPLVDNDLLVGMGIAALGATAAMGVAAARNWTIPDNRFPYCAIGLGTEYMTILHEWRNVVQFKARFGNLGGVSLMADAGHALILDHYRYPYSSMNRPASIFTFSVGAGLDYGGFGFSVHYKPAFEESFDSFLKARIAYDWWVSKRTAINFNAGFGVGGFGAEGLFDYYTFPFGVSLLFKL